MDHLLEDEVVEVISATRSKSFNRKNVRYRCFRFLNEGCRRRMRSDHSLGHHRLDQPLLRHLQVEGEGLCGRHAEELHGRSGKELSLRRCQRLQAAAREQSTLSLVWEETVPLTVPREHPSPEAID